MQDSGWDPLKARESNAKTYPRTFGLVLVHGAGVTVYDQRGNGYIDCLASAGALALGHPYRDRQQWAGSKRS